MKLKEDLIQFIWSIINTLDVDFRTNEGAKITVKNRGYLNRHEGPDFKEAIVKIGQQLWAGNIEIHVNSSDWELHQHSSDRNYDNVILHVVYAHDQEVVRKDRSKIPVLVLENYISSRQLETYRSLMYNQLKVPCQEIIHRVEPIELSTMLQKAMVDRLESKAEKIIERLNVLDGDWNTTFYYQLAASFGFKTNAAPMQALAESISLTTLAKHKDSYHEILGLLFGQAGLIPAKNRSEYGIALQRDYHYLKKLHGLKSSTLLEWKFMKARPANFPTRRIAQFANLIFKSSHLFSKVLEAESTIQLVNLFNCETDEYWQCHSHFDQKLKSKISGKLGSSSVHLILINTVAPMLFAYGKFVQQDQLKDRAIKLLASLPAEKNRYMTVYEALGFVIKSAADSQGVLGLNRIYCAEKQCLMCSIGQKLVM